MYFFWVKQAECRKCGALVNLFPTYELSRRDHAVLSVCPRCLQVVESSASCKRVECPDCHNEFDPRAGVSGRGKFRCPSCAEEQGLLDAVQRKGGALELQLHALEAYCPQCGRFFKRIDSEDELLWSKTKNEFDRLEHRLTFPRQAIPTEGRSDPRPVNHGYTHFHQMFNERQLLSLSMLLEEILKQPDQNLRELLLMAFSDCLDSNNMFCKYEIEWHKISLFFGLHAYHPIERPTENNVWGTAFGRGTFVKCFEKVRRGKVYAAKPHVRLPGLRGGRISRRTGDETIAGSLVESFAGLLSRDDSALLLCQSSEDLSCIPDKSVDAVITDPPYFDNLQYSELADFFYVWLRLALRSTYSWFEPELSGRSREIVQNDKLNKTASFFNDGLRRVFAECRRVLKDDGLLVFTFHHNKVSAWQGLGQLLLDAGFYVTSSPIVRSEGKSGYHSSKGNIKYDCVLVCRKQPPSDDASLGWQSRILDDTVYWTKRTLDSDMPVNEVDVFAITMGQSLKHYTQAVSDGLPREQAPSLAKLLHDMAEQVSHLSVSPEGSEADIGEPHTGQVKQLALFVMESRRRYNIQPDPGTEGASP